MMPHRAEICVGAAGFPAPATLAKSVSKGDGTDPEMAAPAPPDPKSAVDANDDRTGSRLVTGHRTDLDVVVCALCDQALRHPYTEATGGWSSGASKPSSWRSRVPGREVLESDGASASDDRVGPATGLTACEEVHKWFRFELASVGSTTRSLATGRSRIRRSNSERSRQCWYGMKSRPNRRRLVSVVASTYRRVAIDRRTRT